MTGSFNVALAWNALNTVVLGIFLVITYREAAPSAPSAVRRAVPPAGRPARTAGTRGVPRPSRHPPTATSDPSTHLVGGPR